MKKRPMKHMLSALFALVVASAAQAEVQLSDIAAGSTSPGTAELVATVQGTGDVYAVYAPVKGTSYRSVKDRYVSKGLLAMWDAVDNMGHGGHDATATTWRDLTGRHVDMTFTAPPTIGANAYDLSAGGCGVSAPDIADAINNGSATVEIVCRLRSIRHDCTLFAVVDGVDQAAGTRIAWVRSTNGSGLAPAVLGAVEYKTSGYVGVQCVDGATGVPRNYAFLYDATHCVVATNGTWALTATSGGVNGVPNNGWFSLGQRVSMGGVSAGIADVQIHSVRVYDHYLTTPERMQNLAVDQERFFTPPAADLDGAEPMLAGTVEAPFAGAKDYYVQDGLLALWDGEDNQGTGAHVAGATTWKDLTGNHADMSFTTTPTLGANYIDVSAGGGGVSAPDIGAALNAGAATIEIVCDPRELVNDATVFACVDGTGSGAGNRLTWVRSGLPDYAAPGVVGAVEYQATGSYTPYPCFDLTTNSVRSYTFTYGTDCKIRKNGSSTVSKTVASKGVKGTAANAWFSVGQRVSMAGQSTPVLKMRVYCVRVYNRELTAAEIAANHAADKKRFFGDTNEWPLGSFLVRQADGTATACTGGRGVFKLTGLRPDMTFYTARLSTGARDGEVTPSVTFASAAERPAATWYARLDSRLLPSDRLRGTVIDLSFTPNGRVPVVQTRYQVLSGDNHGMFGSNNDTWGTYVGLFKNEDVIKFRYRIGDAGAYAALGTDELMGVHELSFNGPDGTVLNGRVLDAKPAGKTDVGTEPWRLFGRWIGGGYRYNEPSKAVVWNFRLWANGTLVRDLVPAKFSHGRAGMFDRVSRTMLANIGTAPFTPENELPPPEITEAVVRGKSLGLKLTRTGTAPSDVYVVSGPTHGGAVLARWARSEKLGMGFAEGQTELLIEDRVALAAGARYVRFLSLQDGWSASVYLPDTPVRRGCVMIVR